MLSAETHVFSELFLHFNWHCYLNRELITPAVEPLLFKYIAEYVDGIKGAKFFGIGGTETHVHMIAQLEPHWAPAEFVGKVKGVSSHEMNKQLGADTLRWQRGYGVVSFALRDISSVQRYVANQREHHARETTNIKLETVGFEETDSNEN